MALRKHNVDDKVKPGINFILSCPIRFNVSSTKAFRTKLDEYCIRHKTTIADVSRDLIFNFFESSNLNEMLKNKAIKKAVLKLSDTIKDEMGLTTREFSFWYRQAFERLEDE